MAGDEEIIAGIHAVSEALAAGERVRSVIVARHRERDVALKDLVSAARRAGIPVIVEEDTWFRRLGGVRHQHIAALLPEFAYAHWRELRERMRRANDAIVVVADHIEDPQNLGALMRAAEGAGVSAVIIPDRRGARVTAATRRAAAGAASHLSVASVPNLAGVLGELKGDGYWVWGLATEPGAGLYTAADYRGKCALVVGSEGKGLSHLIARRCDQLVRIPMLGKVASLNAAAACAVVLYEIVRQRNAAACENRHERKGP